MNYWERFNGDITDIADAVFYLVGSQHPVDIGILKSTVNVSIYPRLTKYMATTVYIPCKIHGVRIKFRNIEDRNFLNLL